MARFLLQITILFSVLVTFSQGDSIEDGSFMEMTLVNTSGGNTTNNAGSVSYSIGIVNYTPMESSNYRISQGIQQAEQIKEVKDVEDTVAPVLAYPNPATDYIILDILDFTNDKAQYQIFSASGSLMRTGPITAKTTKLLTENWSNATYFVRISVVNKFEETLKIVKQ